MKTLILVHEASIKNKEFGGALLNLTLIKALVAFVPVAMLFSGSVVLFTRIRNAAVFLQLLGAGGLVLVVFTHVCEALYLLPWMHWGREHSIGHYVDLCGAVLGFALFPIGYLLYAFTGRSIAPSA